MEAWKEGCSSPRAKCNHADGGIGDLGDMEFSPFYKRWEKLG